MALTAKPISTISYNTEEHLKRVLEALFKSGRLEDYRYIKHIGEDGDKDHFHLIMFPNRRIDTVELREMFNEATVESDKPLGCLPIRTSKPDHWLMYVLHDPVYLVAHKSDNDGDGKIEYQLEDIKTPFREQLERDYKTALALQKTDNQKIIEAIESGDSLVSIAYSQNINPMKIVGITNLLRQDKALEELEHLESSKDDLIREQRAKIQQLTTTQATLMLKDLEEKTGEDLHTKKKESVFDE